MMSTAQVDIKQRTFHPQFTSPDADVILVSSEETSYRVPSFTLRNTCGFFRTLFGQNTSFLQTSNGERNTIEVDESDKVLSKVLSMVCGLYTDTWETVEEIEDALRLVQKWDAPGPLSVIRSAITSPIFLAEPLRLYAIAMKFGWEEEAQLASTQTLALEIFHETYRSDLERLSSHQLMKLLRLHRARRDEFRIMMDGEGMFEAGNSSRALCTGCSEELDNHTWRELKAKMFAEMDRRPLGDTICSLEMEEWPEAGACWEAKCQKVDCGRLNYNKLMTLKDIRSCIDKLVLHV